jgi:hypothetical protein
LRGSIQNTNIDCFTFPISNIEFDYFVKVTAHCTSTPEIQRTYSVQKRGHNDLREQPMPVHTTIIPNSSNPCTVTYDTASIFIGPHTTTPTQSTNTSESLFGIFYTQKVIQERKKAKQLDKEDDAQYLNMKDRTFDLSCNPSPQQFSKFRTHDINNLFDCTRKAGVVCQKKENPVQIMKLRKEVEPFRYIDNNELLIPIDPEFDEFACGENFSFISDDVRHNQTQTDIRNYFTRSHSTRGDTRPAPKATTYAELLEEFTNYDKEKKREDSDKVLQEIDDIIDDIALDDTQHRCESPSNNSQEIYTASSKTSQVDDFVVPREAMFIRDYTKDNDVTTQEAIMYGFLGDEFKDYL